MKWNEVNFHEINIKERKRGGKSLTYGSLESAVRFQIPKALSQDGLVNMYDKYYIDLSVSDEFRDWWVSLERHISPNIRSCIRETDGRLRLRVDLHTEIFDENSKLTFEDLRDGYLSGEVTVIVEIESVWATENGSGLSVRAHQVKHSPFLL